MTELIYCLNPEIVKTLHVSITVHTIHFILRALAPPPPPHTVAGCIVSQRAHVICCAELKIIFQPEALEWPYVLGERELAPREDGQTSNHRPVHLLILFNGGKR